MGLLKNSRAEFRRAPATKVAAIEALGPCRQTPGETTTTLSARRRASPPTHVFLQAGVGGLAVGIAAKTA